MGVATWSGMYIDMHQLRPLWRMGCREPGFLQGFAHGAIPWCFAFVDVPAGLEPDAEAFVSMQQYPQFTHHNGRAGHVGDVAMFVEWVAEQIEGHQKGVD